MKKCLSVILAVLLLCGGIITGSLAEKHKPYIYTVKDGKAVITGVTDKKIKQAEIPAELKGNKVVAIGESAFADCEKLKTVTVPEGVESIGRFAFENCVKLESINIPDTLTTLGEEAFAACFALSDVEVSPDQWFFGVSNDALYRKKDMSLICCLVHANSRNKPDCEEYVVTDGIRSLEPGAFVAARVTGVILPDSLREIGECAFECCYSMKELEIPEGVETIGKQVFMNDSMLETVTIPKSVNSIGNGVFNFCNSLKNINISAENPCYEAEDLLLIEKETRKIISASGAIEGKLTLPDGIRAIGGVAFQGCANLSELTIPDSVEDISNSAFWGCKQVIIRGHAGSYAQKFCDEHKLKFEVIE